MRILIAALVGLLVNVAYWVQFRGFEILRDYVAFRDYDVTKDIFLLALSAYLLIEALILLKRDQDIVEDALEKEESDKEFLQHELDEVTELHTRIENLQQELHQAQGQLAEAVEGNRRASEERDRLRTAYDEANARAAAKIEVSPVVSDRVIHTEIVSFLGLLQQKGRFVDFVMDDITPYSDAQVGAAARVVHQGCRAVMQQYFFITPVHDGQEGERIELPKGSSLETYRLVGRVVGEPPFRGTVIHRGWKTAEISLPRSVSAPSTERGDVIAPAEIEVVEPKGAH